MHSQNRNISLRSKRGVAQPGSAPGLGPGGRRFESCRPDKKRHITMCLFFCFIAIRQTFLSTGSAKRDHYTKPTASRLVAQLCVDKDTRSSSPDGDLCYCMSSGCVSPASRNALQYTPSPQLRRKAACSGLRIEAGPLARTVCINSHHGRIESKIGNDRKRNSHRSGSIGLTPSAITALL